MSAKIKKLPKKPGVYLFKDASGRIIYIGKAKNLFKRVKSHFTAKQNYNSPLPPLILRGRVIDIDWIQTKNENQAMLLENQLIKKYQPRYNIQWRDDKSYFWVKFSEDEWPRVIISHALKVGAASIVSSQGHRLSPKTKTEDQTGSQDRKQETFIGPFVSGRELRKTLRALRKILPFRTCKNPYNKPCLQWHLGLCPAHGDGFTTSAEQQRLKGLVHVAKRIHRAKTYDYKKSLNTLSQILRLYAGEKIRLEAYDISNIQGRYATGSMIVFYGNKPNKSDYRKFRIKTVSGANDVAMIKEVIRRRFRHLEWSSPDLILIDGGKTQLSAAASEIRILRNWDIGIISLAKREEEIYTEFKAKPLKLSALPLPLKLVFQHIRDEAHRFAIFYYRYLHEARDFRTNRKTGPKTRTRPPKT